VTVRGGGPIVDGADDFREMAFCATNVNASQEGAVLSPLD
jgi:hypothetical protein